MNSSTGVYSLTEDMEMICSKMSPASKELALKLAREMEEEIMNKKLIIIEDTPI